MSFVCVKICSQSGLNTQIRSLNSLAQFSRAILFMNVCQDYELIDSLANCISSALPRSLFQPSDKQIIGYHIRHCLARRFMSFIKV